MSGTSSEDQHGVDEGLFRGDPVSISNARAESFTAGYNRGHERGIHDALAALDEFDGEQVLRLHMGELSAQEMRACRALVGLCRRMVGRTAPQAPSPPSRGTKPLEPVTAQHSGSQAYQENDDGA